MDFFDESLVEIEMGAVGLDSVVVFLHEHGAVYKGETWSPDLQFDEFELEGETIWVVDETHLDTSIKGRPDYIAQLEKRIVEWAKNRK